MECWKDYHGYKVSNYGRIVNRHGREVKGYISNYRGYKFHCLSLRYEGKRHMHRKSILVYQLFGQYYQDGLRVYHIDGNIENCHIDNLRIARAYTQKLTTSHIEIYEKNIEGCVKDYFSKYKYWELSQLGFDVDNLLGEVYLQAYKYLPSFTPGNNFYQFCVKVIKWTFLKEYRKFKIEKKFFDKYKEV